MSKLASCYAEVLADMSASVRNEVLDALDSMQERFFGEDIQIKLDALCAVEKQILAMKNRLDNVINKLDVAISNIDARLANKLCPDMTAISSCMKSYKFALEQERDELGLPDLQGRILTLQGRKGHIDRCGFMGSKHYAQIKELYP